MWFQVHKTDPFPDDRIHSMCQLTARHFSVHSPDNSRRQMLPPALPGWRSPTCFCRLYTSPAPPGSCPLVGLRCWRGQMGDWGHPGRLHPLTRGTPLTTKAALFPWLSLFPSSSWSCPLSLSTRDACIGPRWLSSLCGFLTPITPS